MKYTLVLLLLLVAQNAYPAGTLFFEDFQNLDSWKPLYFSKVKKHSTYTVESEGGQKYLKARSKASASAIVHKIEFNVYRYPRIRWRWKVDNIYKSGDAKKRAGDDFPIRVYVLFKYDPEQAGWRDNIRYKSMKLIYGEYPPDSSLDYIWANKEHEEAVITNPYNDKSQMVLLQKGVRRVGEWLTEEVNIIKDYKQAFGGPPPTIANIAVMNDSDDTGESSVSYIDYIEVYVKRVE